MKETLRQKLTNCVGNYDYNPRLDAPEQLIDELMGIIETHFSISELDLEIGEAMIKSNNKPHDTTISINGKPISVTKIEWTLDAEDAFGKLNLTFV